jgi:hypothetical protein
MDNLISMIQLVDIFLLLRLVAAVIFTVMEIRYLIINMRRIQMFPLAFPDKHSNQERIRKIN